VAPQRSRRDPRGDSLENRARPAEEERIEQLRGGAGFPRGEHGEAERGLRSENGRSAKAFALRSHDRCDSAREGSSEREGFSGAALGLWRISPLSPAQSG